MRKDSLVKKYYLLGLVLFLLLSPFIAGANGTGGGAGLLIVIGMVILYGGPVLAVFFIVFSIFSSIYFYRKRKNKKTILNLRAILKISFIITIAFIFLEYSFINLSDIGFFSYLECRVRPSLNCAYQAAKFSGNDKFCSLFNETPSGYGYDTIVINRDNCWLIVAQKNKNPSFCEHIMTEKYFGQEYSMKDWCYDLMAVDKEDSSICEKIQELSLRESCHIKIASMKGSNRSY